MGRLFSTESKFYIIMSKAGDLIILNLLFLVSSLPIITIGPAVTALYSVALQMRGDEESYIVKSYVKAFKENFKPAFISWSIIMAISFNVWNGYRLSYQMFGLKWGSLFKMVLLFLTMLILMEMSFIFPIISKFYNSIGRYFKYAIMMSIEHFTYTAGILTMNSILIWCILLGGYFLLYGTAAFVLIGFAVTAYINAASFNKIFKNHIKE